MKIPKRFKTHCPFCKKHTEHMAERVKKGRASTLTRITRQKNRQTGIGNSGKFSKVPSGEKPTKRIALKYKCLECNKAHQRPCFRAKKFEFKE